MADRIRWGILSFPVSNIAVISYLQRTGPVSSAQGYYSIDGFLGMVWWFSCWIFATQVNARSRCTRLWTRGRSASRSQSSMVRW